MWTFLRFSLVEAPKASLVVTASVLARGALRLQPPCRFFPRPVPESCLGPPGLGPPRQARKACPCSQHLGTGTLNTKSQGKCPELPATAGVGDKLGPCLE